MRKIQTGRQESHVHAQAHPGRRAGGRGRGRIVPSAVTRWRKGSASMRRSCPTSRFRKRRGQSLCLSLWRALALPGAAERSLSSSPGRPDVPMRFARFRLDRRAASGVQTRGGQRRFSSSYLCLLRNTGRAFHLHGSVMKKSFRIPKVEIPLWRAFPFRALGISKKVLSFCLMDPGWRDEFCFRFFFSSLTSET